MDAPVNLRDVLKTAWKNVILMSYESYETVKGVSIALGIDQITGDIFCALSMASSSSVLCSRMDKNKVVYVREYCYAGDDKNETLTPSNTAEGTFLNDTMLPIVVNQVNAKHKDYIVIANDGSNYETPNKKTKTTTKTTTNSKSKKSITTKSGPTSKQNVTKKFLFIYSISI